MRIFRSIVHHQVHTCEWIDFHWRLISRFEKDVFLFLHHHRCRSRAKEYRTGVECMTTTTCLFFSFLCIWWVLKNETGKRVLAVYSLVENRLISSSSSSFFPSFFLTCDGSRVVCYFDRTSKIFFSLFLLLSFYYCWLSMSYYLSSFSDQPIDEYFFSSHK